MYENLFSHMFHINLLQDWNDQDTSTKYASVFFFFTSVCQNLLVNVLPMPDYWSKKNWKKLVLKCHKDHFSQQSTYLMYCGVDELSITYCSILVICMPLTLHAECPIFAFRCRLILLKSFYQLPPSVQILLTLPAVFEGLLINYCDTSCHML